MIPRKCIRTVLTLKYLAGRGPTRSVEIHRFWVGRGARLSNSSFRDMERSGYIENVDWGVWTVTEKGRALVQQVGDLWESVA